MDDRSLQVRGCSVRKFTGIVALWFAVILVGTDALAADFTESFEDQDFIDLTNLTANLSVEEQAVYLAWSNSQQHRLPDSITPGTAIGSDSELILLSQWYWVMWTVMATLIWWRVILEPTNCT